MADKIQITRQIITAPSRKLTARWSIELEKPPFPLKGVKEMNEVEQADEIIRRLSQPYKTPAELEELIMTILSSEMAKEMDREVLGVMNSRYTTSTNTTNAKESNT